MNQDDSDTDLKLTLCIICQREDSRKVGGISYSISTLENRLYL